MLALISAFETSLVYVISLQVLRFRFWALVFTAVI